MELEVKNLHKTYEQGKRRIKVLKGLDLKLASGESVAILGRSGSGKSTLLSLLAGLDDPSSGDIRVHENSLIHMSEKERTSFRGKNIGIVFQQYHLVDTLTALENVELPLLMQGHPVGEATKRAQFLLEQVGLQSRGEHFPRELSGGECQRVAIARSLIHNPKVLLADEPSGNLDQETGQQVMALLFQLLGKLKMTALLVTHSLELARLCDRQLELTDGQLVPL